MNIAKRATIVLAILVLSLSLTAIPVLAFDARSSDQVTVSSDEVVNEDLYLAGRTVLSNGTVNADVFAAGQLVTIGGVIANGLTAAGQTLILNAEVGHGVRAAGSTIDFGGSTGRDLMVAGSTITLTEHANVGGDLALGAETAVLRGSVQGNLRGAAEELIIEGSIGGNVDVHVETLVIRPGASIGGNLTYTGQTEADIPAGTVEGDVTFTERAQQEWRRDARRGLGALAPLALFFASLAWNVIAYLMAFITGLVLILLMPRRMAGATGAMRTDTGPVAGWGALALFVTPLAAIIVSITIVGLSLGIIALLLWGILLYLAQLPVGILVGHLILGHRRSLNSKGFMIGSLALGLLILALIRVIPVLSFFVWLAIAIFGLGAFVVGERRLMQSRREGADVSNL